MDIRERINGIFPAEEEIPAEIRLDGLSVAPARWGETPLLPVPLIAVGETCRRPRIQA